MKECSECGQLFEPRAPQQRICTPECKARRDKRLKSEYASKHREKLLECRKRYYKANREKYMEAQREYRKKKPPSTRGLPDGVRGFETLARQDNQELELGLDPYRPWDSDSL